MAFRPLMRVASPWIMAAAFCLCRPHEAGASDPDATLRWMASQPFRYGGEVSGGLSGHMVLAFGRPDAHGRVSGKAMMLQPDRHLVGTGMVDGRCKALSTSTGQACTLTIKLPRQTLAMDATCSADTLSGDFTSQDESENWLARQVFWWTIRQLGGQAWMTKAAFYD